MARKPPEAQTFCLDTTLFSPPAARSEEDLEEAVGYLNRAYKTGDAAASDDVTAR